MKKILTADNSETFLNVQLGESYHSQTGAVEEALKKYALPCKIAELAKTGKMRILDVCFGMGYNSAMAISVALEENPECDIEVVGLEYDPMIISKIQEVNPAIPFFSYYKQLTPMNLQFTQGKVSVRVLLGDAREKCKELPENYFDAIFFDPFSPKTSPEMWQVPFFQEMWRVIKSTGILATYSCARMARDNISAAGFLYNDGPLVGRR
ncbi:MAG: MnmC family methyltransferase, partial [Nanoarchaeota archaeon]